MGKKEKDIKTNAMRLLDTLGIPYEHSSYECEEFKGGGATADALGLDHEMVYKTLVTETAAHEYFVFVIPTDEELDLKKAARAAGVKALSMLPMKQITQVTGYVRGGCTSLGMKKHFPTFLQEDAQLLDKIAVSGGKIGLQLTLAPDDYCRAAQAEYVDIVVSSRP